MSVTELWTICALKINTTVIGQITDQEVGTDIQELLAADSGAVYSPGATIGLEGVRFRVTTEAVKSALAAVGLTGAVISVGAPVEVIFQQYTAGGTRTAGACVSFKLTSGLLLWRSLNASAGQLASVELEIIGTSADGTTAPYSKETAQAIPTYPTAEMYMAKGTDGVQDISIDTGIEIIEQAGDADAWPTFVAIDSIKPRITVSKTTMGTLGIGAIGSVELLDCAEGGYRGSSPITFTFAQETTFTSGIGGRPSLTKYEILASYNGVNAPIAISGLT